MRECMATSSNPLQTERQSWNPRLFAPDEHGLFRISRWLPRNSGGWRSSLLLVRRLLQGCISEMRSLPVRMGFQYRLAALGSALGLGPLVETDHNGGWKPCTRTLACIRDTQNFLETHPTATRFDQHIHQDAWLAGAIWASGNSGTQENTARA